MNSFYWLEPSWKSAECPYCGVNIWDSGGDPDWGMCYECRLSRHQEQEQEMICCICKIHPAVADVCGLLICSKQCADEVERNEGHEILEKNNDDKKTTV